jgi:hypothetical protein
MLMFLQLVHTALPAAKAIAAATFLPTTTRAVPEAAGHANQHPTKDLCITPGEDPDTSGGSIPMSIGTPPGTAIIVAEAFNDSKLNHVFRLGAGRPTGGQFAAKTFFSGRLVATNGLCDHSCDDAPRGGANTWSSVTEYGPTSSWRRKMQQCVVYGGGAVSAIP